LLEDVVARDGVDSQGRGQDKGEEGPHSVGLCVGLSLLCCC
jgi:hypothetical protein